MLVATPGDASANSYATLTDFNSYAATRLPALAWFVAATDGQKEAALQAGARALDAYFDWTGTATDDVQALCWPRNGMFSRNGFVIANDVVPKQLKDAQCEMALQLGVGNRLADNAPLKKGVTSLKAGSVALSFADTKTGRQAFENAQVEIRRQQSDLNYVSEAVPDEVRRLLPAGWFNQADIQQPLIFEAL